MLNLIPSPACFAENTNQMNSSDAGPRRRDERHFESVSGDSRWHRDQHTVC